MQERKQQLLDKVRAAGARLIGPNCMGIINTDPSVRLNATFAPVPPIPGRVAFSTQSGALGLAILDYVQQLRLGISTFVSVGTSTGWSCRPSRGDTSIRSIEHNGSISSPPLR